LRKFAEESENEKPNADWQVQGGEAIRRFAEVA
jgi:hypothetical protein